MSYFEEYITKKERENSFSLLSDIIKETPLSRLSAKEISMLDKHFETIKETSYANKLMISLFEYDIRALNEKDFLDWFFHLQKFIKLQQNYKIDSNIETPFLLYMKNLDRQGYSFENPPNNLFILDTILKHTEWETDFLKNFIQEKMTFLQLNKCYILLKAFQKNAIEVLDNNESLSLIKKIISNINRENDLNKLYDIYTKINENKKIQAKDDLTALFSIMPQEVLIKSYDKFLLLKSFLPKVLTHVRGDNLSIKVDYTLEKEKLINFIQKNHFTEQEFYDIYFSNTDKISSVIKRGNPINQEIIIITLNKLIEKYNEIIFDLGFKQFKYLSQDTKVELDKLEIFIEKIKLENNIEEDKSNETHKRKLKL